MAAVDGAQDGTQAVDRAQDGIQAVDRSQDAVPAAEVLDGRAVRRIYLLLIVAVIGGMVLHNALDFYRKSRHILKKR